MILGLVLALLMVAAGVVALLVARHAVEPGADAEAEGRVEQFAARVHDGLGRTANAVDVRLDRRPAEEVLRAPAASEDQRTAYAVFGSGLVGLGVVLAIAVVLLLG